MIDSTTIDLIQVLLTFVSTAGVVFSLVSVSRSNKRLAAATQLSTLQAMVSEMNQLRQIRVDNPDLERELFASRKDWSELQIQRNLIAVELANVFEWAYLARRSGIIEKDVWESWVTTWVSMLRGSQPLADSFTDSVWTFGRSPEMAASLNALVRGEQVADPLRSNRK